MEFSDELNINVYRGMRLEYDLIREEDNFKELFVF